MKLYIRLEAPYEWVRVSGQAVQAFGEVAAPADFPLSEAEEIIGVIPGEYVTTHTVNVPARSRRQFQTAVPYALEEAVSQEVEQLHFSCSNWQAGAESVVYVAERAKMLEWQALANLHQLAIDRLVPEYALLPFHDAADCTLCLRHGTGAQPVLLARQKGGNSASLDPDFVDIWLLDQPLTATIAVTDEALAEQLIEQHPDRDFRFWDAGNKLAHWLDYPVNEELDLYVEEYRPQVRRFSLSAYSVPAKLALAAIVIWFGYDSYRYFALHLEIRSIDAEQRDILASSFPELEDAEPGRERYLMEQGLARMSGGPIKFNAPHMLAEVAVAARRLSVTLSEVVYRDGRMVISCQLSDFAQVDQLTRELNARPRISAQLESSSAEGGRIVASYTITAG